MHVCVVGANKYVQVRDRVCIPGDPPKYRDKILHNLGRLAYLQEKSGDPNILDKIKAEYRDKSNQAKAAKWQESLSRLEESTISNVSEIGFDPSLPLLNFGWYVLREILDRRLELSRRLRSIEQRKRRQRKKLAHCVPFLVYSKILAPRGILPTLDMRDSLLGNPLGDSTLDDLYDTLDFLKDSKEQILTHLNRKLDAHEGTQRASLVFYDVTNAYFETALSDEEKGLTRNDFLTVARKKADEYIQDGRLPEGFWSADGTTSLGDLTLEQMKEMTAFIDELTDPKNLYLRQRGPSKEHRYDLPLISLVMVIDRNGIPMDYEIYSGNSSEFKTMPEMVSEMKKKYNFERTVLVADRGLNSGENLEMLQKKGFGFLMAQKISGFNTQQRDELLDESRFRLIDPDDPARGKYLEVPNYKRTGIKGATVDDCSLVITFNEARKRRDEKLLDIAIEIIKSKQNKKVKGRHSAWMKLAKTDKADDPTVLGVDEIELARQKQLCGYAAMIYKKPPKDSEGSLTGAQIAQTYHRLNRIENCFRIMKKNLRLRPMYVWTARHIEGHVLACFLALVTLCYLTRVLRQKGVDISLEKLILALQRGLVAVETTAEKEQVFIRARNYGDSSDGKTLSAQEWKRIFQKHPESLDALPSIMQAVGLRYPPRLCTRKELSACLGTHLPAGDGLFSERVRGIMEL